MVGEFDIGALLGGALDLVASVTFVGEFETGLFDDAV
jgi:hypothetical protein